MHYGRVTSPLALLSRVNKPSGPGAHSGLLARVEPAPYRLLAAADQESGDDSDDEEESGDGDSESGGVATLPAAGKVLLRLVDCLRYPFPTSPGIQSFPVASALESAVPLFGWSAVITLFPKRNGKSKL